MTPPPNAAALEDLARRVEALTGPDRELDVRIAVAVLPDWHGLEESSVGFHTRYGGQRPYTASLDAAMTLVPQPGRWSVTAGHDGDWQAFVWSEDGAPPDWRPAATPALALTAASLRARALLEKNNG